MFVIVTTVEHMLILKCVCVYIYAQTPHPLQNAKAHILHRELPNIVEFGYRVYTLDVRPNTSLYRGISTMSSFISKSLFRLGRLREYQYINGVSVALSLPKLTSGSPGETQVQFFNIMRTSNLKPTSQTFR